MVTSMQLSSCFTVIFVLLQFPSLLEEKWAFHKSSPVISFFSQSGCIDCSMTGTRIPVFHFGWFSRFLLDGLSVFYNLVSMRWLFLRAWFCPFSIHAPTIYQTHLNHLLFIVNTWTLNPSTHTSLLNTKYWFIL